MLVTCICATIIPLNARGSAVNVHPRAFGWYLAGYRRLGDRMLTGLARMGFAGAWAIVLGITAVFVSKALGGLT